MCDTFAVSAGFSGAGHVFGKNSDREPDEVQLLEAHPARDHGSGEALACTYVRIPQVEHTHAVLISRPFWMWGAEMGVNDHGVVIGNEAVFARQKTEAVPGLIGMDLLRLALERSESAREAVAVITTLLSKYGQGGACGYRDKKFSYMNAFLIMDRREILVLETCGRDWAVKAHDDRAAISNGYSLGADWDEGTLAPGTVVRELGDPLVSWFAGGDARRGHNLAMIDAHAGAFGPAEAFAALRGHHGARPGRGFNRDVCMHFADPLIRKSQTVQSLVVCLDDAEGFAVWAACGSGPCLNTFVPVAPAAPPAEFGRGGERFSADSAWWRQEELAAAAALHRGDAWPGTDDVELAFYPWGDRLEERTRRAYVTAERERQEALARLRKRPPRRGLAARQWRRLAGRCGVPV